MRIISSFKDYYDKGSVYGIDKERIYVRETKDVCQMAPGNNGEEFEVIGFCGKIYPIVNYSDLLYYPAKDYVLYGNEALNYTFIETDSYNHSECKGYKKIKIDARDGKKASKYNKDFFKKYTLPRRVNAFNDLEKSEKLLKLFLAYKVPIFYIGTKFTEKYGFSSKLIINPRLEDFAFYKVMNTVQAFQEIFMFIGSELAQSTQSKVPVGNDEVIGNSKGFDRYSFRNINTKKKPKKF